MSSAWQYLHPTEGKRVARLQGSHEALHALVASPKTPLLDQVLVDPDRGEPGLKLLLDRLAMLLAQAPSALGPGGHFGRIWIRIGTGPGGHFGRFWRPFPTQPDMPGDRLPVDSQLGSNLPEGAASLVQEQ